MEPDAFRTAVLARLQQLSPPPAVQVRGPLELVVTPEGGPATELRLHNLWWSLQRDPSQLRTRLDQVAGALLAAPTRDKAHLVPVLRTREHLPAHAPQLPFVGPLHVATALDGPYTRRLVLRLDADLLQLRDGPLFHVAHNNLKNRATVLQRQKVGEVSRLVLDGDLDSALVLLQEPWRALRATSRFFACAPSRGVVLYTEDGSIGQLRQAAEQVQIEAPWPLPLVLLRWQPDGFVAAGFGDGSIV